MSFYKSHPAKGKNIFYRGDKSPINLIDLYHGKSIFLICNGPSFNNINKDLLHQPGILTMTVNNGGHVFRSNFWTGQDSPIKFMDSIWQDPNIMKFVNFNASKKVGKYTNIIYHYLNTKFKPETWLNQNQICWGLPSVKGSRSILLAALHIIYFLGFKKVYLLGADFKMSETEKYFFDERRSKNSIIHNNKLYENVTKYLTQLIPYFREIGFEIYNCNQSSNLKIFPFVDFENSIKENIVDTSKSTLGMYEKSSAKNKKLIANNKYVSGDFIALCSSELYSVENNIIKVCNKIPIKLKRRRG